jgi:hypothetical protein
MTYVAPFGTYRCISSNFPGIFPGTIATWLNNVWTVNGMSYPGGIQQGQYAPIPGGFQWRNGFFLCKWQMIQPAPESVPQPMENPFEQQPASQPMENPFEQQPVQQKTKAMLIEEKRQAIFDREMEKTVVGMHKFENTLKKNAENPNRKEIDNIVKSYSKWCLSKISGGVTKAFLEKIGIPVSIDFTDKISDLIPKLDDVTIEKIMQNNIASKVVINAAADLVSKLKDKFVNYGNALRSAQAVADAIKDPLNFFKEKLNSVVSGL